MSDHANDYATTVAADLIEYLIVEVPDLDALASLVPALAELVETAKIRILDLVAHREDPRDGAVAALELDAVDSMTALMDVDGEVGGMLSRARHRAGIAGARGPGPRASSWSPRIDGRSRSPSPRSAPAARSSAASASRPPESSRCSPSGPTDETGD